MMLLFNGVRRSIGASSNLGCHNNHRLSSTSLLLSSSWRRPSSQISKTTSSSSSQLLNYHQSNYSNFAPPPLSCCRCCYSKKQRSSSFAAVASFSKRDHSSSNGGSGGAPPLRRRRKKTSTSLATSNNDDDHNNSKNTPAAVDDSSSSSSTGRGEAFFSPINSTTGHLLTSEEYLQLASLSPWVPCPDVVSKRVFEIAMASNDDIHVDLGCGDGRLNFMAVDTSSSSSSFATSGGGGGGGGGGGVKKSWGVDVDENILKKCYERLGRRFVPPKKMMNGNNNNNNNQNEEEERLEFVQADLLQVIKWQKELYQERLGRKNDDSMAATTSTLNKNIINDHDDNQNNNNNKHKDDMEFLQSITNKISNSTIITMYFVDNALQQLQPYLSSILGGKKNVRVVTIGYEMPNKDGWNASWVERVLGLTIFRYDMENVSRFPSDWNLDTTTKYDDDDDDNDDDVVVNEGSGGDTQFQRLNNSHQDDDDDVEEFLRQKRLEDFEELNRGLRIHHDEELDEFAHARAKRQGGMNTANSQSTLVGLESDDDDDDDVWDDFDETEEPEELMKGAQRKMVEARKSSRGKLMVGVGEGMMKTKSSTETTARKPTTWKKP